MDCVTKSRGPRGSPCCTPSEDQIAFFPQNKDEDEQYTECTKGYNLEARSVNARSILKI